VVGVFAAIIPQVCEALIDAVKTYVKVGYCSFLSVIGSVVFLDKITLFSSSR
jgi:hypothetical protein